MVCEKCGKENTQGGAFCIYCGACLPAEPAQQPEVPVQETGIKKLWPVKNIPALILGAVSVVLAIVMVLSLTGAIGTAGNSSASRSFSTPEDAINYFVNCVKNGDYNGALSACAIDEEARGFDYKAYVERLKAAVPLSISLLPSEYKNNIDYNRTKLKLQLETQIIGLTYSMQLPEKYSDMLNGKTMSLGSDKTLANKAEDIFKSLEPADFKDLSIEEIDKANMHDTASNREVQKKQANIYGAEDEEFRSILYKYNGEYYLGGFTLIKYNGRWMVSSLVDPLAGIPALGTATKLSGKSDFYSAIGK